MMMGVLIDSGGRVRMTSERVRIIETIEESQIKIDLTHINVSKGCVDGGVVWFRTP